MSSFTFVHAADLHLDSPFQGLKEVSPEIARVLHEATFKSLATIVEICIKEKANFLVLSGDIFDHANYSLRAWLKLREQLTILAEHNIQTFIAWGNHDFAGGSPVHIDWPDKVFFFPPGEVAEVIVSVAGKDSALLQGISYPAGQVTESYAGKFKRNNSLFHIAVLHCNVGEKPGHGNYAPCSLSELLECDFDYWALGHVHTREIMHPERPVVAYPGNSQGRHFRETGARGCYLVRVKAGQVFELVFKPTEAVRWQVEDISLDGIDSEQLLLSKLYSRLEQLSEKMAGVPLLLRLRLTGRSKLHKRLNDSLLQFDLLAELRESLEDRNPFIWLDSIKSMSRPNLDMELILSQDSLAGDFLRLVKAAQLEQSGLNEIKESLSPLLNNRRIRQSDYRLTEEKLKHWLEEAMWLGLDYLTWEEE
ncbi:metallophosphoesterase [Desulfofarcimen acetoxidans DSM 771]|jgi:DNA repair exonuclease SbcCD nuclease subunit|uniref:Metallophosphoesterase n=1 Tax=Desulfofarcimen acetoxidans (strain ATCC 49208 / DSM 771 / KCTC 5769 / VKM B-1644 / 5575) TaxID=485916 RepID=C8VX26_DESAS|nr:DNA repair exonuclease [Desulfofarcimen acetoxidans]ACV62602.1 metallophosphoesterase [Desulfofarcimen acetoxidans DSM 771]